MTVSRPTWDEYFELIACVVSLRATCPRAKVGAVIVSADNRILATGYNGAPAGEPQCDEIGCDVVDGHCQRSLHAECNAVGYAAQYGVPLSGGTLYLFSSRGDDAPCRECAKILAAADITYRASRSTGSGVRGETDELRAPESELPEDSGPVECHCGHCYHAGTNWAHDGVSEDSSTDGNPGPQGQLCGHCGVRSGDCPCSRPRRVKQHTSGDEGCLGLNCDPRECLNARSRMR